MGLRVHSPREQPHIQNKAWDVFCAHVEGIIYQKGHVSTQCGGRGGSAEEDRVGGCENSEIVFVSLKTS